MKANGDELVTVDLNFGVHVLNLSAFLGRDFSDSMT